MFRKYVLPTLVWLFYSFFAWSWKKQVYESPRMRKALENGEPLIFAHWHGDELAILHLVKRYQLATMTSTSKDGQLIDYVIKKMGGATSKGSSTRGGISALKGLIRLVNLGHPASMAVDGPKGPIYQVKPGVFELSRLTGALIVPIGAAADSSIHFKKSWNKTFLPKPFSRSAAYFDDPMEPIQKGQDCKASDLAESLSVRIFAAKQHASKLIAQR